MSNQDLVYVRKHADLIHAQQVDMADAVKNPYLDENGWWWLDENGERIGPFDLWEEAAADLRHYCRVILA